MFNYYIVPRTVYDLVVRKDDEDQGKLLITRPTQQELVEMYEKNFSRPESTRLVRK